VKVQITISGENNQMYAIKGHYEGGRIFVADEPLPQYMALNDVRIVFEAQKSARQKKSINEVAGCLQKLYRGSAISVEDMNKAIPSAIGKTWNP
jgi:hypothetical protein